MGSRILKRFSASDVGNSVMKATPALPVVFLDLSDEQFDVKLRDNIIQRCERDGAPLPYETLHYYKCGCDAHGVLEVVNAAFEDLKFESVSTLYILGFPRNTPTWVLNALGTRFHNVMVRIHRGYTPNVVASYVHKIDLFPDD